ncbi:MAG TPA: hypothetical protein VK989_05300 [Polyangia bacterium]|jgi:hypothetical protein|nr:hypothetical protein [Polyangia bacterium]
MSNKGKMIAAIAAGLFSVGAPLLANAADAAKVHCEGANACKGKGSCHSASNACAGKNGCKGKGWTDMTEKDCKAAGGKISAAK